MSRILFLLTFLLSLIGATSVFADECTLVGSFTQGAKSTSFSWKVTVNRNGESFKLNGKTNDEYGAANVSGNCDLNHVCLLTKTYTSGQSKGSTFFYAGQATDDSISGKWGFKKGAYTGGNFSAQVIDCR